MDKMTMTEFCQEIQNILIAMQTEGIEGWGINNPAPDILDKIQVGPVTGCMSDTCHHNSHDPAVAVFSLIPRESMASISDIGRDGDDRYYAYRHQETVRLFKVNEDGPYWDWCQEIQINDMPAFLLACCCLAKIDIEALAKLEAE